MYEWSDRSVALHVLALCFISAAGCLQVGAVSVTVAIGVSEAPERGNYLYWLTSAR